MCSETREARTHPQSRSRNDLIHKSCSGCFHFLHPTWFAPAKQILAGIWLLRQLSQYQQEIAGDQWTFCAFLEIVSRLNLPEITFQIFACVWSGVPRASITITCSGSLSAICK